VTFEDFSNGNENQKGKNLEIPGMQGMVAILECIQRSYT
jgi:hypothetical protein